VGAFFAGGYHFFNFGGNLLLELSGHHFSVD
jgi:hypothetical protein